MKNRTTIITVYMQTVGNSKTLCAIVRGHGIATLYFGTTYMYHLALLVIR